MEVIEQKSSGLSMGAIIGIIAGGVIVLIAGIVFGVKYSSRLIKKKAEKAKASTYECVPPSQNDTPNASMAIKARDLGLKSANESQSVNQV